MIAYVIQKFWARHPLLVVVLERHVNLVLQQPLMKQVIMTSRVNKKVKLHEPEHYVFIYMYNLTLIIFNDSNNLRLFFILLFYICDVNIMIYLVVSENCVYSPNYLCSLSIYSIRYVNIHEHFIDHFIELISYSKIPILRSHHTS